jgi:hypothetical protein
MYMNNRLLIVGAVIVIAGGAAAYFYWPQTQPVSEAALVQPPQPVPAPPPLAPEIRNVLDTPTVQPPLPSLTDSDKLILDALAGLVGNKSLMKVFRTDRFIHNFVATIDNLPGRRAPMSVLPVESAPGQFIAAGSSGNLTISPKNAARYTAYVRVAMSVDPKKLVGLYVRLYPLFQQAYEELGYPNKYFNDRLIVVLDDLLAAPIASEPVKLVQPNVLYQYADPNLEKLSIGQRILIRLGGKNEDMVKTRLHKIRQELMLHVHEKKVERAG